MALEPRAMKTEAVQKYRTGFALTESELRRLHEVLIQQIMKTPVGDKYLTGYELKYRNGSVSYPASIEDVLAQENFGTAGITRLQIEVFDKAEKPSNKIGVQFTNVDEEENYHPISYLVSGEDRDWVFVTSSQLDERIGKIKLFSPNQIVYRKSNLLFAFPFLISMVLMIFALYFSVHHHVSIGANELNVLERNWKSGTLKDSTEVTIQAARIVLSRSDPSGFEDIWPLGVVIVVPVSLLLLSWCWIYFQPSYNFLWGDYVTAYEKRRSRGRFLLIGILLAIVVSVAANFISKKIGL